MFTLRRWRDVSHVRAFGMLRRERRRPRSPVALQRVVMFQQRDRFPVMSVRVSILVVTMLSVRLLLQVSMLVIFMPSADLLRLFFPHLARQILLTVCVDVDLGRAYTVALHARNLEPRPNV